MAPAQASAFVTPRLMSPIQLQCEQGLVNTPDVFVYCPCHGVNQCGPHILLSRAKRLMGAVPSALAVFWFGVSVSSCGLPASLSPSYRPWSTEQGEISHQAPPLMAQLYFYCKISVIPAVQGPACLLQWFPLPTFATVNSLLVLEFWYTGPSTEKRKKTPGHRSTDDPRRALFPWIHELYSNRSTDNQDRGLALNPKDLF